MDQTHILVDFQLDADKQFLQACMALYGAEGKLVYMGAFSTGRKTGDVFQGNTRRLKVDLHESIIRFITRNCTELDVGVSTPIFTL